MRGGHRGGDHDQGQRGRGQAGRTTSVSKLLVRVRFSTYNHDRDKEA